jgi:hypothetical protein
MFLSKLVLFNTAPPPSSSESMPVRLIMPRDVPDPGEPVNGPQKQVMTEKAKEAAALVQATKQVRPAAPAPSHSSMIRKSFTGNFYNKLWVQF